MSRYKIALVRTNNFTARLIQIGGYIEAKRKGIEPRMIMNHAEIRHGDKTSGALSKGVKTREWLPYWLSLKHAQKKEYVLNLTPEQARKGQKYLDEAEGTKYEYSMFLFHALKIFFGVWFGSRSSRKLFCFEHIINFLNATGKYSISPYISPLEFDLWAEKNLT